MAFLLDGLHEVHVGTHSVILFFFLSGVHVHVVYSTDMYMYANSAHMFSKIISQNRFYANLCKKMKHHFCCYTEGCQGAKWK